MGDATDVYEKFLNALQELVEEAEEIEEDEEDEDEEHEVGGPAAELGPLAEGVVSILADEYAKGPDEKVLMKHMKLDELLSYLGERRQDDELIAASRAAARILAALRWFHYGAFFRPPDEKALDWETEASLVRVGLDRLGAGSLGGGKTNG